MRPLIIVNGHGNSWSWTLHSTRIVGTDEDPLNFAIGDQAMEDRHRTVDGHVGTAGAEGDDGYGIAHAVLVYLVALLLTLPLFIIVYPFVPEMVLPVGEGVRL